MPSKINELIDFKSGEQQVCDLIMGILTVELENQQLLATDAGKNPEDWNFRLFKDRARVLELFRSNVDAEVVSNRNGVVNVWFERDDYDPSTSTQVEHYRNGTFNIDCYGMGVTTSQDRGDTLAATESKRVSHVIMSILLSEGYRQLGNDSLVWGSQRIRSKEVFMMEKDTTAYADIVCSRLSLDVTYNEKIIEESESVLLGINIKIDDHKTGDQIGVINNGVI